MRKLKLEMQVSIHGFASHANRDPSRMLWCWGENWTWTRPLDVTHGPHDFVRLHSAKSENGRRKLLRVLGARRRRR